MWRLALPLSLLLSPLAPRAESFNPIARLESALPAYVARAQNRKELVDALRQFRADRLAVRGYVSAMADAYTGLEDEKVSAVEKKVIEILDALIAMDSDQRYPEEAKESFFRRLLPRNARSGVRLRGLAASVSYDTESLVSFFQKLCIDYNVSPDLEPDRRSQEIKELRLNRVELKKLEEAYLAKKAELQERSRKDRQAARESIEALNTLVNQLADRVIRRVLLTESTSDALRARSVDTGGALYSTLSDLIENSGRALESIHSADLLQQVSRAVRRKLGEPQLESFRLRTQDQKAWELRPFPPFQAIFKGIHISECVGSLCGRALIPGLRGLTVLAAVPEQRIEGTITLEEARASLVGLPLGKVLILELQGPFNGAEWQMIEAVDRYAKSTGHVGVVLGRGQSQMNFHDVNNRVLHDPRFTFGREVIVELQNDWANVAPAKRSFIDWPIVTVGYLTTDRMFVLPDFGGPEMRRLARLKQPDLSRAELESIARDTELGFESKVLAKIRLLPDPSIPSPPDEKRLFSLNALRTINTDPLYNDWLLREYVARMFRYDFHEVLLKLDAADQDPFLLMKSEDGLYVPPELRTRLVGQMARDAFSHRQLRMTEIRNLMNDADPDALARLSPFTLLLRLSSHIDLRELLPAEQIRFRRELSQVQTAMAKEVAPKLVRLDPNTFGSAEYADASVAMRTLWEGRLISDANLLGFYERHAPKQGELGLPERDLRLIGELARRDPNLLPRTISLMKELGSVLDLGADPVVVSAYVREMKDLITHLPSSDPSRAKIKKELVSFVVSREDVMAIQRSELRNDIARFLATLDSPGSAVIAQEVAQVQDAARRLGVVITAAPAQSKEKPRLSIQSTARGPAWVLPLPRPVVRRIDAILAYTQLELLADAAKRLSPSQETGEGVVTIARKVFENPQRDEILGRLFDLGRDLAIESLEELQPVGSETLAMTIANAVDRAPSRNPLGADLISNEDAAAMSRATDPSADKAGRRNPDVRSKEDTLTEAEALKQLPSEAKRAEFRLRRAAGEGVRKAFEAVKK